MTSFPEFPHVFRLGNILAMAVVVWLVPLMMVPVFIWLERKGSATIQDRLGPNRASILGIRLFGMLHNIADAVKLFMKEDVLPKRADRLAYYLAPALSMTFALLPLMVVPFAEPLSLWGETLRFVTAPTEVGLLLLLALSGLGVFGVLLAGWGSNNKFSMMGGLRASSQFLSYELGVGLAALGLLMAYGTADVARLVEAQGRDLVVMGRTLPLPAWGILTQPIGFLLFLVGAFAETNRTPFDLPEGDSELVSGFHMEYSSMKFALFFMSEYAHMTVASVVLATLFLGGYQVPFVATETLRSPPKEVLGAWCVGVALGGLFLAPILGILAIKRPYDKGGRRELTLYAAACLVATVGALVILSFLPGWAPPMWVSPALTALTQAACLMAKAFFFCWLFVWVRWTLPRFRFDQLMDLGWRMLLPLGLLNAVATGLYGVLAR